LSIITLKNGKKSLQAVKLPPPPRLDKLTLYSFKVKKEY